MGAGMSASWLKGHLDFGSSSTISDLKIGDAGNSAVYNRAGAAHTSFMRCQFRGGGSLASGSAGPVVSLGFDTAVLRHPLPGLRRSSAIWAARRPATTTTASTTSPSTPRAPPCPPTSASSAVTSASPTVRAATTPARRGWASSATPRTAPPAGSASPSPAAPSRRRTHTRSTSPTTAGQRSSGVLVDGCLIKGGGYKHLHWGYAIDLEMPLGRGHPRQHDLAQLGPDPGHHRPW